jgi:sigma-B regulation protein RsbU (phosphoserine phosphatase)
MFASIAERTKSSLRLRLLVATLVLLALALAVAAVAFERVARSVIVDAVHSHLSARAEEVQAAVVRFQRERALAVRNWAEAEAMQMTVDSGDPKFAEDYLRRTIQDQGGTIAAAALLDMDGAVIAAVREGAAGERRGVPVVTLRGVVIGDAAVKAALEGGAELSDGVAAGTAPLSRLDPTEGGALGVMVAAPVKDFAADLVGVVVAVISPQGLSRLLGGIAGEDGRFQPIVADEALGLVVSVPGADALQVRALAEAATGAPGALETITLADADPALSVRTAPHAGVPGWRTLMAVQESDAYGRLYWLRAILGVLFVLVLAVAGVASIGALRQAARPLSDITNSMTQVASGDLSTRVPETYTDELGHLAHSFNVMVSEVERSRDELQRTEALRREVEIAHRIQTAILPVAPSLSGYEVAARMKPADDVGGDLYDLLPFDDTFWVLVGDVSGHGINSGLVMMMAQAAAYAAIAENPRSSPKSVIAAVNRVVHENVRRRMRRDDYLTLMAARHLGNGRFVAAGAHQPIFLSRANGKVDVIEPAGPWCGLGPSVQPREYEFEVHPGEMLCLITDGVVEAPDARGDLFGEDRLAQMLSEPAVNTASASQALAAIFSRVEAFAATQADDMTAVVLRRQPHA